MISAGSIMAEITEFTVRSVDPLASLRSRVARLPFETSSANHGDQSFVETR